MSVPEGIGVPKGTRGSCEIVIPLTDWTCLVPLEGLLYTGEDGLSGGQTTGEYPGVEPVRTNVMSETTGLPHGRFPGVVSKHDLLVRTGTFSRSSHRVCLHVVV